MSNVLVLLFIRIKQFFK